MGGPFDLEGTKALVVGVANDRSIAWGVARALREAGAELAITYLNEKAETFVRPLAEALDTSIIERLDVEKPEDEDALFERLGTEWGRLDTLVHSVAFAPLEDLRGPTLDASEEGFSRAMDVSVHSFIRLARRAEPLMTGGGACLTMSFYGAQKVVGSYNIMGPVKAALEATVRELAAELGPRDITVNALSPGTIATRAASGIEDFDDMLAEAAERAPMRRLATIGDVGSCAAFLASRGARSITGTVIPVDGGRHILG